METLFRLTLVRPPTEDKKKTRIKLEQKSQFQTALGQAKQSANPREAVKAAARQFVATPAFVGDPASLPIREQLEKLSAGLDVLEQKATVTKAEVVKAVEDAFGAKVADLVKNKTLEAAIASLKDSIVAIKLLPEEHSRPIDELTDQLRDLEVILKVAAPQDFSGDGEILHNYRRRSALMPAVAVVRPSLISESRQSALQLQNSDTEARMRREAQAKVDRYKGLKTAYEELTRLSLQQLSTADQNTGIMPPPDIPGSLSPSTRELLQQRNLGEPGRFLEQTAEGLRREMGELSQELDTLLGRPVHYTFKRVGNTPVVISTPMPSVWNTMVTGNNLTLPSEALTAASAPKTHAKIKPVGVADLLVVKQHLARYEGADVAHIENVLKGEKKEREHTVRRETEETIFRETEVTTSEEKELESTDRLEMSRETSKVIKQDSELSAKVSVSAKYGPVVEVSSSVEGSIKRSREESTRTAASFSKDVTQRSAAAVTERVLERYTLRVTNEVTEKNNHAFDNVTGNKHISGVYQWVNKVYQAQMYNYGIRAMFDFMVPEPGAFLIEALQNAPLRAIGPQQPAPFNISPGQISETNYLDYVRLYGAEDVVAPPVLIKTVSFKFGWDTIQGGTQGPYETADEVKIPLGYRPRLMKMACNWWPDAGVVYLVVPGANAVAWFGNTPNKVIERAEIRELSLQEGLYPPDEQCSSIPVVVGSYNAQRAAIAVQFMCTRTDRALRKWQLETHAKLTTAYKARLAEYETKQAALEVQAGFSIEGKNPSSNLDLIRDELKKDCITIMTEQYFDWLNAIELKSFIPDDPNSPKLRRINLEENEQCGPYVRFFEQAFEWENMTWIAYPYFWGRKSQWAARISYDDPDPIFNQFVKAGYCRVVVPARPGFESAIAHFMETGDIWNGGPLPAISDDLYLSIADEIAERLKRPGEELPQGDPWEVTLPTDLVHLRADDELPEWIQKPNGEWVEKADRAQREQLLAST